MVSSIRAPQRVLALDLGSKTIGTALCLATETDKGWPAPHQVLKRGGDRADILVLRELITKHEINVVVVGLPLELDGRTGPRARRTLVFAKSLRQALADATLDVEVLTWDERFSTTQAERSLLAGDFNRMQRKERIDAVAAHFILENWLSAQENLARREAARHDGGSHEQD
jgi:putative Holliday junction resolvase